MGEARRRKAGGEQISWCRTCTLCCTLPDILALDKPMYRPCRHLRTPGSGPPGCSIFGQPERPAACHGYVCAHVQARMSGGPERTRIPHPLEAGAYVHRDPVERALVLFVDPARPELWKRSGLVDWLRPWLMEGYALLVLDRGRRMTIVGIGLFEAVLQRDFVVFAQTEGRPLDIPEFATEWPGAH